MANTIRVKLVRGTAGQPRWIQKVMKGLGLRRPGHTVTLKDTPAIRGMVFKIIHCLEVVAS